MKDFINVDFITSGHFFAFTFYFIVDFLVSSRNFETNFEFKKGNKRIRNFNRLDWEI